MANPAVVVDFIANTSDLKRKFSEAKSETGKLSSGFKSMGKAAAIGAGAAGLTAVVAGATKAVMAASDLNESINAVKVTFGDAGDQILAFSKKAATQAGLSMNEFNGLVVPVGASLRNVGFSADEAAKKSIALTKRAADMASVFNTSVPEALQAIQAGLRGEADPLERFGVGLSDAAVKAEAMKEGLAASEKALTAQDKATARINLLMKQTAKTQGDFVNTSDSLANQQRILKAQFENVAATVGQKLLPIITSAISWLRDHWPEIQAALERFWKAVEPILAELGALFVSVVDLFQEHWGTIGPIVERVLDVLSAAAKVIAGVIKIVVALLKGDWAGAWQAAKDTVVAVVNLIKAVLNLWVAEIKLIFSTLWNGLVAVVNAAWQSMVKGVKDGIADIGKVVTGAVDTVKGWGRNIANWIKDALVVALVGIGQAAWGVIDNIGSFLATVASTVRGWGTNVAGWIKNAVVAGLGGIGEAAWNVINNIGSFLVGVKDTIVGWGKTIGSYIKDGITAALSGLGDLLSSAVKKAFNAVIGLWNAIHIPGFHKTIKLPLGKKITVGWDDISVPQIPTLAKGGIVTSPTLAMIGEAGPEAVVPLSTAGGVTVRVFIGDQELRGLVRTEVVDVNTGIARTLLAGAS